MYKYVLGFLLALTLGACASAPKSVAPTSPKDGLSLPDKTVFVQTDPKWSADPMGGAGKSMKAEGCLVTATAMALSNMGLKTDPGELNKQLKKHGGYTKSGQLIWSGIDRVTEGKATARFFNEVSDRIILSCMEDGFYPMARFILPNGRTHWSMIVKASSQGYHMRDPLHESKQPLIFPAGVSGFKAVRCVGPAKGK